MTYLPFDFRENLTWGGGHRFLRLSGGTLVRQTILWWSSCPQRIQVWKQECPACFFWKHFKQQWASFKIFRLWKGWSVEGHVIEGWFVALQKIQVSRGWDSWGFWRTPLVAWALKESKMVKRRFWDSVCNNEKTWYKYFKEVSVHL